MRALLSTLAIFVVACTAKAETLTFSGLKPNETIIIAYRSSGCFHLVERQYRITGGERIVFAAFEMKSFERNKPVYDGDARPKCTRTLSDYESFGLDAYLYYLRGDRDSGCTTVDEIAFGFYRDGKKIGEERFEDGSCFLSQLHWEKDRVSGDEERRPRNLSLSAYRAIVPPWLVEERFQEKPNQSLQPNAGASPFADEALRPRG